MKRREFLGAAATLAISATAGPHAARGLPGVAVLAEDRMSSLLADRLLRAYPLKASLATIGDALWDEQRQEPNARPPLLKDAVRRFLLHLNMPEAELVAMSTGALRDRIRSWTAHDFSEQRIIQVRGWLLGETEARLCAIASLRTA